MSDAPELAAMRSIVRTELRQLERKMQDRFDWLEERLEWLNQGLERRPRHQDDTGVGSSNGC